MMTFHYKFGASLFLILTTSACTNPFSGHKPERPQDFRTASVACNKINLDQEEITWDHLQRVVECLNTGGDVQALSDIAKRMTPEEAAPWVEQLNTTLHRDQKSLFIARKLYQDAAQSGRFDEIANALAPLLNSPERNRAVSVLLAEHADEISKQLLQPKFKLQTRAILGLIQSPQFQRLMSEFSTSKSNGSDSLRTLLVSTSEYLNKSDALDLNRLLSLVQKYGMHEKFAAGVQQSSGLYLTKVASFMDWLFSDQHLLQLSRDIQAIQNQPLNCFQNKTKIERPIEVVTRLTSQMDPKNFGLFVSYDARILAVVGRGFCDFPYSLKNTFSIMDEAQRQPGYDLFFQLIKPALTDPAFIAWTGSSAFHRWVLAQETLSKPETRKHFFYDLLSTFSLLIHQPISDNQAAFTAVLNQALKSLSKSDVDAVLGFIQPIRNDEAGYGMKLYQKIYFELSRAPAIDFSVKNPDRMTVTLTKLLKDKDFSRVLDLSGRLFATGKLSSLIQDLMRLFQHWIDRGRHPFQMIQPMPLSDRETALHQLLTVLPALPPTIHTIDAINVDWDFSKLSTVSTSTEKASYLSNLDNLFIGLDGAGRYTKTKDSLTLLINQDHFPVFLDFVSALNFHLLPKMKADVFSVSRKALQVSRADFETMARVIQPLSALSKEVSPSFRAAKNLRSSVARLVAEPHVFRFAAEWLNYSNPIDHAAPPPALISRLDVRINENTVFKNVPLELALKKLFEEYCPSLDSERGDCDLDDDQVLVYRQSPSQLAKEIGQEYFQSITSWLHPKQHPQWLPASSMNQRPTRTDDFNTHLIPLVHEAASSPLFLQSFVKFFRITSQPNRLARFINEKSLHLTLIPYVYQVPHDLQIFGFEHHDRIRIRIASDLDLLEGVSINSDFKAFGLMKNFGLTLIAELGLAWGDVPPALWPVELKDFKQLTVCPELYPQGADNCVRTLKQAKALVYAELAKFDRGIITRMGDCDTRSQRRFGAWIRRSTCSRGLFDISSRLFNTRIALPVLEITDLDVLRDLFYALHSGSPIDYRGWYPDGLKISPACLDSPTKQSSADCRYDYLESIPRIARLGLLHQVGVLINQTTQPLTSDLITTLQTILKNESDSVVAAEEFFSSNAGARSIDATQHALRSMANFSVDPFIVKSLNLLPNKKWFGFMISLLKTQPDLMMKVKPLLELNTSTAAAHEITSAAKLYQILKTNPDSSFYPFFKQVSAEMQTADQNGITRNIVDMVTQVATRSSALKISLDQLATIKMPSAWETVKKPSTRIVGSLGDDDMKLARKQISKYIQSESLDAACRLASDPSASSAIKNILVDLQQFPDTLNFLNVCGKFLDVDVE